MKKILVLLTAGLFIGLTSYAQNQNPAMEIANKQAKRMQDTLGLPNTVKQQLYQINMDLHNRKLMVRQQYSNDSVQLGQQIQRVENTRDSLYRNILAEDKYLLYLQKKRSLLNNN